jgi:CheY-like chemotaxis protein
MEAIGQLTAGLAHDFNNLLQIIIGNLDIAAMRAGDDAVLNEVISRAQQAGAKGARLTQQLLTFARKQRLEPKRVNLNTLVVEFSEMLSRTLGDKVDLRLDLKPGLPACTVDPTHMEMALLNVLINARDAMPNGGRVTVATATLNDKDRIAAHHLSPGNYVMICVIDDGEGMDPEVLHRATEPFFTTKGPGTGLGLAMVHGFVQQSHGRLEIDSERGKGTVVRMFFPVAAERATSADPGTMTAPDGKAGIAPQTILLVEDSDDVRQVADMYLRSLGYQVVAASSGEEALALLEKTGRIDLLFTDVIMPGGMNGLVLAEKLRQLRPGTPVLLATGYMDEAIQQGANVSAMSILSKPYRGVELAEKVRAALNKGKPIYDDTSSGYHHEG